MITVYRTHAAIAERLEKLEAIKTAAEEFLLALHTDPMYPFQSEEALSAALKELHKTPDTVFSTKHFFLK